MEDRMDTVAERPQSAPKPRKLLSVKAISERCDIPESTVYEMARQNRIGGVVRLGRKLRFDPDKFEAWLDAGGEATPQTYQGRI